MVGVWIKDTCEADSSIKKEAMLWADLWAGPWCLAGSECPSVPWMGCAILVASWAHQLKRLQLRNPGCEGGGMLSAAVPSQKEMHPTSSHNDFLKNKRSQHGWRGLWACGRATENEGAPAFGSLGGEVLGRHEK